MASLYDLASELLDDLVAALGPDYERAYVHAGQIAGALVCGQVAVSWQGLRIDRPPTPATSPMRTPQQPSMPVATYEVRVTSCVPAASQDGQPTAAALDESARHQLDTVATVWGVVRDWCASHELTMHQLSPLLPVGPSGTEAGVTLQVSVGLSSGVTVSGS